MISCSKILVLHMARNKPKKKPKTPTETKQTMVLTA
jgi:hypothetical protein